MATTFNKRTYKSIGELIKALWFPFKNREHLKKLRDNKLLSPAFKERLMLAVTEVNDCRYCSYFHTRQALKSGVSPEEINRLLSGDVEECDTFGCNVKLMTQI